MDPAAPLRIAVVQAAPVFMDREATIERTCEKISEAGRAGARLVAFPESYIPGYPDWVWAVPPGQRKVLDPLYAELLENSIAVPDEATRRLGEAARAAGACVVLGINERNSEASGFSLYNTLLFLAPDGSVMGRHRKLVPTAAERTVWAPGDGSTLQVFETPLGRLGGLTCWENYMPLARYALYAGGVELYVAATWDRGEPWLSTLRHLGRESGAYVLGCCMTLRMSDIPDRFAFKRDFYAAGKDWINVGGSAIVGPGGEVLAGPLMNEDGILFADVDRAALRGARNRFDVAGHYARPDVFGFGVRREAHPLMRDLPPREPGS